MKTISTMLCAILVMSLSSCNKNYQALTNAANKVLNHAEVKPPYKEGNLIVLEATVKDMYPTEALKSKCPYAVSNFDIANASLHTKVKCHPDSIKALKGIPAGKLIELLLPDK